MSAEVRIERAGNRIFLGSDMATPGLQASIPGAYFRKDGMWSLPLDLTTCHLLRERFGKRLAIGPALLSWARAEKAAREMQAETAGSDDADLRLLPSIAPLLAQAMDNRPYQKVAPRFVADSMGRDGRRRALIADTVGLGKTAEALGAVLESEAVGPFLVVCPKGAVNPAWRAEIQRRLPDDEIITIPEGKKARDEALDRLSTRSHSQIASLQRTWVIVHPYSVRTQTWWNCTECGERTKYKRGLVNTLDCEHPKDRTTKVTDEHNFPQIFAIEWGAVIADESDQMLIMKTGTPNLQRRGMEMLRDLVPEGGVRIAMSGTPFRSKPHQIWSTLNWLDPVRFSAKWRWIQQYWTTGGYSGYEIVKDGFQGAREHLLLDELRDIMLRRTREEVRGDLPPKDYPSNVSEDSGLPKGIWLDLHPLQEKAYKQLLKSSYAELASGELSATGVLAEITRLRQFAGAYGDMLGTEFVPEMPSSKYDWLLEFARQIGLPDRPDGKLVVASQFTKLLNLFRQILCADLKIHPPNAGLITGDVSGPKRDETIAIFEDLNSDMGILFINTKAGGSAITLDAADKMVILDETHVDDEQEQLEGRIDNRNPERRIVPRSYYYLRCLGTIEEDIAAANVTAKAAGRRLLNADYKAILRGHR